MKIKKEDYKILENGILKVFEVIEINKLINTYEAGNFERSEKVKDLQKRFCFDILYYAKILKSTKVDNNFINELYVYLNDDNIYTALKHICPKVERKY